MSATETIIGFAVKQVLDKTVGGPMPVITAYHKAHFILLTRALTESNRDSKLQDTLREVDKNLQAYTRKGRELLALIPNNPQPPSSDLSFLLDQAKAANLTKQIGDYIRGVKCVIDALETYLRGAQEIAKETEANLKQIEAKLNMNDTKVVGMRAMSNHYRTLEVFTIREDIPKLRGVMAPVESLLRTYKIAYGQQV